MLTTEFWPTEAERKNWERTLEADRQEASTKTKPLPPNAWRVNKTGFGCNRQERFLELPRNFDRYDAKTATERLRDATGATGVEYRCSLFAPGDVVFIDEMDKWLHTVKVYRDNDRHYTSDELLRGADRYYTSKDLLDLRQ